MSIAAPERAAVETPRGEVRTAPVVDAWLESTETMLVVEVDGHRLRFRQDEVEPVPPGVINS
ncbi:MAG: hypothetical protein ABEI57_05670 [Halapricum sp.]